MIRIFPKFIFSRVLVFLIVAGFLSCKKGTGIVASKSIPLQIDLSKKDQQHIYNLRDGLQADSLSLFLRHENPNYRLLAADGYSSIKSPNYIDSLAPLLQDDEKDIRIVAAYALGQQKDPRAVPHLLQVFNQQDSSAFDANLFATALEAIGKCGDIKYLDLISNTTTYTKQDKQLLLGQARAIYRFALRGITSPAGTGRMLSFLCDAGYESDVEILAANYLARAEKINFTDSFPCLINLMKESENPFVQKFLIRALAKTGNASVFKELVALYKSTDDFTVQQAILSNMRYYPYNISRTLLHKAVYDPNENTAGIALDLIEQNGSAAYGNTYRSWALRSMSNFKKSKIYGIVMKYGVNGKSFFRTYYQGLIDQKMAATQDPSLRSNLIKAVGYNPYGISKIGSYFKKANTPVEKSNCASALVNIIRNKKSLSDTDIAIIKDMFKSADLGAVSTLSGYFNSDKASGQLAQFSADLDFESLKEKFVMPKDFWTYIELERLEAKVKGESYDASKWKKFSHPINWENVTNLSANPSIKISTSKGNIVAQLFPSHAPGTVSNMVELIKMKYYDGKNFHRVIPNFVIQGGGVRNDGYGSLDYQIRSELGQKYYDDEGYLAMASSGRHTECAQWFISTTPTPHLDGEYTIFGKVIQGMEVVKAMSRGDLINSIELIGIKTKVTDTINN